MKNYISNLGFSLIIIVLLALYFTYINNSTKEESNYEEEITIKTDEKLEDYIIKVVACEMPALYEEEALKAQAIASRTYALYQRDINNVTLTKQDQCFNSEEEMKEKWSSNFNLYYKKIKNAVESTASLVMKIDNKLFKSFYFSTSNGYTEDSMTVFKEGNIKSVSSEWDKENKNFEVKTYFEKQDLIKIIGEFNNISITKRSKTNHVEEVSIDDKTITGIEFRKLLNLRSTDFEINNVNDTYEITTFGYGHGVGMSQFGANMLAKDNKTSEEILKYYYGDIEISKY
ncbi:MAG: stage II sporulation protein D [Erysipelotrichales bacterium]|nr:stage II sporulation protein D [Erysipelotrichales bacterium]